MPRTKGTARRNAQQKKAEAESKSKSKATESSSSAAAAAAASSVLEEVDVKRQQPKAKESSSSAAAAAAASSGSDEPVAPRQRVAKTNRRRKAPTVDSDKSIEDGFEAAVAAAIPAVDTNKKQKLDEKANASPPAVVVTESQILSDLLGGSSSSAAAAAAVDEKHTAPMSDASDKDRLALEKMMNAAGLDENGDPLASNPGKDDTAAKELRAMFKAAGIDTETGSVIQDYSVPKPPMSTNRINHLAHNILDEFHDAKTFQNVTQFSGSAIVALRDASISFLVSRFQAANQVRISEGKERLSLAHTMLASNIVRTAAESLDTPVNNASRLYPLWSESEDPEIRKSAANPHALSEIMRESFGPNHQSDKERAAEKKARNAARKAEKEENGDD